jgi:hypothetical protein
MTQTAKKVQPGNVPAPRRGGALPPLVNGDHLSREEFERRYDGMPGLKKAELIEGVVHMAPPVSIAAHSVPHGMLAVILGIYALNTQGVVLGDNGSIRLDLDNMMQPDLFLAIDAAHGGQAKIDADDVLAGAPELIAEIAASSASYDLHEKLHVYRRSGVREYIVWRTADGVVDYFHLLQGEYSPLPPSADGSLRSKVFPGLWLDPAALLSGDGAKALQLLTQGLSSAEHAAFVAALKARANH